MNGNRENGSGVGAQLVAKAASRAKESARELELRLKELRAAEDALERSATALDEAISAYAHARTTARRFFAEADLQEAGATRPPRSRRPARDT